MDKARQKTNKQLKELEANIGKVYKNDLALIRCKKKYDQYMAMVYKRTEGLYLALQNSDAEHKAENEQAYKKAVLELTEGSPAYKKILSEFVETMARVNQKALDLVNAEMPMIYTENYNQVAVDCRKAGIDVYGD